MEVRLEEKYRFVAETGRHQVVIDQPVSEGGTGRGMDPVELFVASLAGCAAYYAVHYMERNQIPTRGFRVEADWEVEKKPYRIGTVRMTLHLPDGFPEDKEEPLLAVCRGCTLHHTLDHHPVLEYTMTRG